MQNQLKSFFDQEVALAEVELPQEHRNKFLKWTKRLEKQDKLSEKLKASLEMKNNEFYLKIDDDDVPFIMNITDLKQPMNKCNLLIPTPPYNDPQELQKIHSITYKARAKIENNSEDYAVLNSGMRKLSYNEQNQKQKIFSTSQSSDDVEVTESDSDSEFQELQQIALSHKDILKVQQRPTSFVANSEVDKGQVKKELFEFLRTKGDKGATMQEIKQNKGFSIYSDNVLKDILKDISKRTKRQSRIYYFLPSTLLV